MQIWRAIHPDGSIMRMSGWPHAAIEVEIREMDRVPRTVLMLILLPTLAMTARAAEKSVSGRVLDAKGKPVKDAVVAATWTREQPRWEAKGGLVTNQDGEFSGKLHVPDGRPLALLALDKAQQRGGLVLLEFADLERPVAIKIEKLVSVHGSFETKALHKPPKVVEINIFAEPGNIRVAATGWTGKEFALKLPPGSFVFRAICEGADSQRREVVLTAQKEHTTVNKFEFKPATAALGSGKKPPAWNVTDARGIEKSVQLSDFEGKWVLIEFWGFW
jgi:hypothetical protein